MLFLHNCVILHFHGKGGSWGASFWMPTYVERRIKLDALNAIKATVGEPYIVHEMSSTTPYRLLVFQSLCDACGVALAALLVDRWGRRSAIQCSFLCASCALLILTLISGEEAVLLMSGTMQFAQAIAWVVISLYTAEAFATPVRSTAMGFASTLARIGAIGAPLICGYLIQEQIHAAMWFCSGIFFAGFLTAMLLGDDRTGKEMTT
jgi:MFS transporter, putative metabolite:H+ symporter